MTHDQEVHDSAPAAHADAELDIDPDGLTNLWHASVTRVVVGGAAGLALTYAIGRLFGTAVG